MNEYFRDPLTEEQLTETVDAWKSEGSIAGASRKLGITRASVQHRLKKAAENGLCGYDPVIPGFRVSQVSTDDTGRKFIQQKPERGETFALPDGHVIKGISTLVDEDNRQIVKWIKTREEDKVESAWRDALDEFKADLPRLPIAAAPLHTNDNLCVQYTVTDLHFGLLAWAEETRDADYDLQIAEKLLTDWFSAAIAMAPAAGTAVFAQLGDLLHYDSMETVTPTSKHIVDGDSRPQKMIRVVIRTVRRIIGMLLEKHDRVHVIMAKANHDTYSSAWLRESLAAMYENEPRLTVETSPAEYYSFEFGKTALFYHHGHKRQVQNLDTVFAGMFREVYGRCTHSYGHCGHFHNDEVKEGNLMKTERHRTLAPRDSYAAGGGYLSKRDAKVIVYHREFGEVSRLTLSPEMVRAAA